MEVGAILRRGARAAFLFPFPFILMIAAVALWFLSMDLAALVVASPPAGLEQGLGVAP